MFSIIYFKIYTFIKIVLIHKILTLIPDSHKSKDILSLLYQT